MEKNSKIILEHLKKHGGCDYYVTFSEDIEEMASALNMDLENLRANIRYLHENNYIDYQHTASGNAFSFSLSHQGLNWKYFRRQETISYIKDKWIDFIALCISIIAFILSVIALAR